MTNFSENGGNQTYEQLLCSAKLAGGTHSQLIFLTVLNIFLSITAFLGNTLILVALRKETSLHAPSKLLFRSLATTDLCVGIIVEPLVVTYLMSTMNEQQNGRFHTRRRTNRLTVCSTNVNSRWPTLLISKQISRKPWFLLLVPFPQDEPNRPFVRLSTSDCEFRSNFGRLVLLDEQIVFKKSSSQTNK